MNTNNMPNYLANLARQGVDAHARKALAQVFGNCAQPANHRGGMNVNGSVRLGGPKTQAAGNFGGGDMYMDYRGGDGGDFFGGPSFEDNRSWSTTTYGDTINKITEMGDLYQNVYNEGDSWAQYNDNSVWDMSSTSNVINQDWSSHITHGDEFSFPMTNEFITSNFFEGNEIIHEGNVTNKHLTVNEGDTIHNTTTEITNEGDTYNITEEITEIKEGDNYYITNKNQFVKNVTEQIIYEITHEHTTLFKVFNNYITNIFKGGKTLPVTCVGPVMSMNSPLNYEKATHVEVPTYAIRTNGTTTVAVDSTACTVDVPVYEVYVDSTANQAVTGYQPTEVNGKQGAVICAPGLGAGPPV